ncbi:hypothetical protein CEXT_572061 [Caerostris extrusa]|uniref:Glycine-rich protein n=1 Tax=Caerostris extrusa TaxID=172846 RepID=A0AAV4Q4X2_CAEEX|nr:hypothetical protein CEXT_572061 [Caerostris extrusa]
MDIKGIVILSLALFQICQSGFVGIGGEGGGLGGKGGIDVLNGGFGGGGIGGGGIGGGGNNAGLALVVPVDGLKIGGQGGGFGGKGGLGGGFVDLVATIHLVILALEEEDSTLEVALDGDRKEVLEIILVDSEEKEDSEISEILEEDLETSEEKVDLAEDLVELEEEVITLGLDLEIIKELHGENRKFWFYFSKRMKTLFIRQIHHYTRICSSLI